MALVFLLVLFFSTNAYAYIGPGMGGGIVAATLGIVVAIVVALLGIVWFPIKRALKRVRTNKENDKKDR